MVAANRTPLHIVGDEDSSKRRQILDGARRVFLDLGFDGASMGEIARAAGVSKGTLYVYFADKSRLFEAIVEEESLEQGKVAFNFDPERDVTTTLVEFGQAYIQLLCRPGGGSAIRTVMAIAERMPDVGRRFYNNVVALTIGRLAAYLEVRVAAGDLEIEDCQLAAAQFMQMCQALLFMPFVFQAAPSPSAERIVEVVESATRMFLAGYRAKGNWNSPRPLRHGDRPQGGCGPGVRKEDTEDTASRDQTCTPARKGNHMTIPFEKLKARLLANPKVRAEYDALAPEFEISAELLRARLRAGLSQAELAARMGTSQSTIARLESGQTLPSTKTLLRYAQATGNKFHVRLSAA